MRWSGKASPLSQRERTEKFEIDRGGRGGGAKEGFGAGTGGESPRVARLHDDDPCMQQLQSTANLQILQRCVCLAIHYLDRIESRTPPNSRAFPMPMHGRMLADREVSRLFPV